MKESQLQSKILTALRKHGGWWVKYHAGQYAKAGVPDILGVYKRRFVAMEVKRPNTKVTKLQAATLQAIRKHGIAVVVRSVDEALRVLYIIDAKDKGERRNGKAQARRPSS